MKIYSLLKTFILHARVIKMIAEIEYFDRNLTMFW